MILATRTERAIDAPKEWEVAVNRALRRIGDWRYDKDYVWVRKGVRLYITIDRNACRLAFNRRGKIRVKQLYFRARMTMSVVAVQIAAAVEDEMRGK